VETTRSLAAMGKDASRIGDRSVRGVTSTSWWQVRGLRASGTEYEHEWSFLHACAGPRSPHHDSSGNVVPAVQYGTGVCSRRSCVTAQVGGLPGKPAGCARSATGCGPFDCSSAARHLWQYKATRHELESLGRDSRQDCYRSNRTQVSLQRCSAQSRGHRKNQAGTPRQETLRRSASEHARCSASLSRQDGATPLRHLVHALLARPQ